MERCTVCWSSSPTPSDSGKGCVEDPDWFSGLQCPSALFGQYRGYHEVAGVAPGSTTETYAAVRLALDSWQAAEVPTVIRAGKSLPVSATEVNIRFRRAPYDIFDLDRSLPTMPYGS